MLNIKRWLAVPFALAWCAGLVGGCGHPAQKEFSDAPDWVNYGGGSMKDEAGNKFIYGVGSVTGIPEPSLQRETADARARADIAKVLNTYVASLGRDYEASTSGGSFKKASGEQSVEQSLKSFTNVTVAGAEVVKRHFDKKRNILFSLCKLDLARFKELAAMSNELTPSLKAYIKGNADAALDRVDAEIKKSNEKEM